MSPASPAVPALLALDIGARQHAFAFEHAAQHLRGEVDNTPAALRTFLTAHLRPERPLRVLVEATGVYSLDVALIAAELGAEVMVVNPKAAHNFAKALQRRNKTDALDAAMLLEFLKRMPWVPWTPPSRARLELRHYGRYLTQLTQDGTAARNRLHALGSTQASPAALRADLKRAIAGLDRRIERLRREAVALIQRDPELNAAFKALIIHDRHRPDQCGLPARRAGSAAAHPEQPRLRLPCRPGRAHPPVRHQRAQGATHLQARQQIPAPCLVPSRAHRRPARPPRPRLQTTPAPARQEEDAGHRRDHAQDAHRRMGPGP